MLLLMQTMTAFVVPENYVTMEKAMLDPKGQNATQVWYDQTPSQAKAVTVQQAGWIYCLAITMISMVVFEPGCDRDLCICWLIIFINWTFVWFGSCMLYADVDGPYQVPWTEFFKWETLGAGELVFSIVFGFLGFTDWGKEQDDTNQEDKLIE